MLHLCEQEICDKAVYNSFIGTNVFGEDVFGVVYIRRDKAEANLYFCKAGKFIGLQEIPVGRFNSIEDAKQALSEIEVIKD